MSFHGESHGIMGSQGRTHEISWVGTWAMDPWGPSTLWTHGPFGPLGPLRPLGPSKFHRSRPGRPDRPARPAGPAGRAGQPAGLAGPAEIYYPGGAVALSGGERSRRWKRRKAMVFYGLATLIQICTLGASRSEPYIFVFVFVGPLPKRKHFEK